jgi:hypothetical protein
MNYTFKVEQLNPVILSDGWHEYTIDANHALLADVNNGVKTKKKIDSTLLQSIDNKPAMDICKFENNHLSFDLGNGQHLNVPYSFKKTIPNSMDPRRIIYLH